MKFKDFQAPVLFSSTFKALNLGEKKFKYFQGRMRGNWEPCTSLIPHTCDWKHRSGLLHCGIMALLWMKKILWNY